MITPNSSITRRIPADSPRSPCHYAPARPRRQVGAKVTGILSRERRDHQIRPGAGRGLSQITRSDNQPTTDVSVHGQFLVPAGGHVKVPSLGGCSGGDRRTRIDTTASRRTGIAADAAVRRTVGHPGLATSSVRCYWPLLAWANLRRSGLALMRPRRQPHTVISIDDVDPTSGRMACWEETRW